MNHDSEATTQIYLARFDASVVDKANLTYHAGPPPTTESLP